MSKKVEDTWNKVSTIADKKAERKLIYKEEKLEQELQEARVPKSYYEDTGDIRHPVRGGSGINGHPNPKAIVPTKKKGMKQLKTLLQNMLTYTADQKSPLTGEMVYCTYGEQLMATLIKKGLSGNVRALELIFDRLEGKATTEIELNADINVESRTHRHDLSALSVDELLLVKDILQKTTVEAEVLHKEDDEQED